MNPDTCNWQMQTMLHMLCMPNRRGRDLELDTTNARILLDAGAAISAREEQFSSTPLALAARNNNPGMLRFLLSRGAPMNHPDDKPWATPLARATRRPDIQKSCRSCVKLERFPTARISCRCTQVPVSLRPRRKPTTKCL